MDNKPNLRILFVQMLFALSIGQVAIRVGDLVESSPNFLDTIWNTPYVYTHLILCVALLSTSWVGWYSSNSLDDSEKVNSIFSKEYLILLIDLSLVICYFVIIRGSEVNNITHKIDVPNVSNETFWTMIIFIIYFVWDIFTKLIKQKYIPHNELYIRRKTWDFSNKNLNRCWQSISCFVIALIIFIISKSEINSKKAVIIDTMLIVLVFIFRALKQEVKQNYKLTESQLTKDVISEYNFKFPVEILQKHWKRKFFVIKILPVLILIFLFILYFKID